MRRPRPPRWRRSRRSVTTARMNSSDLERWRRAGAIACHVRNYVASMMKPGARLIDLALAGHKRMEELGGKPAFPLQMSRNHIAAHYCAYLGDTTVLEDGDLCKLDVGVHVDGFVADTAATVDLSSDGRHAHIIAAAREALDAAIAMLKPGLEVVEIGRAVEKKIRARGLNPVKNLTGHSVDRWVIHGPPSVPNVPVGRGRIEKDVCIAIEPFATNGSGVVKEHGDAHVFMARRGMKKVSGTNAKVIDAIRAFNGLPFGSRDLLATLPFDDVSETLNALARVGFLAIYPPLCERPGTFVAQFEHTIHVGADKNEVLTANEDALCAAPAAGNTVTGG